MFNILNSVKVFINDKLTERYSSFLFKIGFMVQFKDNFHKIAEKNLKRQEFETFLPMQEVTIRKPSRFLNKLVPLFPGYMFIAFDPKSDIGE